MGASSDLLGRMLRYMASVRIVEETDTDTFTSNNVTRTFTDPGFVGGVYHYFDYVGPGVKCLPDVLGELNYQTPVTALESPLLKAWNAEGMFMFDHYNSKPKLFKHFNNFVVSNRQGMPTWLDKYPYKEAAASLTSPDQVFFVDIGGGFGHQAIALREELPSLPNRIIVEDVAQLFETSPLNHPGVETLVQDYFEPQQIKGAKVYYMRNIVHDHPDDTAVKILQRTKDALGPDSLILIDDMYLDNKNQHWHATQIDLTMMLCFSAKERMASQWEHLIRQAGLKIQKIYKYTDSLRDSIIECVPA